MRLIWVMGALLALTASAIDPECPFHGLAPLAGQDRLVLRSNEATLEDPAKAEADAHQFSMDLMERIESHAERLELDVDAVFPAILEAAWVAKELKKNAAFWGNGLNHKRRIQVSVTADGNRIRILAQDQSAVPFNPQTDAFRRLPGETDAQMTRRKAEAGRTPAGSEGLFFHLLNEHGLEARYHYLGGNRIGVDVPWNFEPPAKPNN